MPITTGSSPAALGPGISLMKGASELGKMPIPQGPKVAFPSGGAVAFPTGKGGK